ncbi:pullulanase [Dolosigranulum pigrum]|jgi:pullulanase, extracellular|nr:pullulanase [Dolosigranulum pigrum]
MTMKRIWQLMTLVVLTLGVTVGLMNRVQAEEVASNTLRIHFEQLPAEDVTTLNLWTWEDVAEPSEAKEAGWPSAGEKFSQDAQSDYGHYIDITLKEGAKTVGFLLNNDEGEKLTDDIFVELSELDHSEVWIDRNFEVHAEPVKGEVRVVEDVVLRSDKDIQFKLNESDLKADMTEENIQVLDTDGKLLPIEAITELDNDMIQVTGNFTDHIKDLTINILDKKYPVRVHWKTKDTLYGYDGALGADLHEDGTVDLAVWSPSADQVSVVLYDKDDQYKEVAEDVAMSEEDGVWRVTLTEDNTGISNHEGYYYHYKITRGDESVLALDPYAKSMATWSNVDEKAEKIGKAAIVNPSTIGPDLDYAQIDGYEKREDGIIYETHVRDFTSDPTIDDELTERFGTFAAFAEKLDYIESLGVTHIQLLPVMSYLHADEFNTSERWLDYVSSDTNYNWGYDPQSYFSLSGMYTENPDDPMQRIAEFKALIDAIHDRGMGVILDVVYNHTASIHILEDLEPEYYHFMDNDGTTRESFGGGRLGTTHQMSRKLLVDSIKYWTDEYKVDGFRFDMMGDHDAETIQQAHDEAAKLNANILMIGEGWQTYVGDEDDPDVQPADQTWMNQTSAVGSFSDDFRNELKSGFGSEGEQRFITGGKRSIEQIFDNLVGQPHNFEADEPGDVVPYIAAHDNLTLHDVIAHSIQKDPDQHEEEIQQRIRLGNFMTLIAQGTSFIHSGQEYGRTKQFRDDTVVEELPEEEAPHKSTFMTDEQGKPFKYPYFIHDSYDSSDAINHFDWAKATNGEQYPLQTATRHFTAGMIDLRRQVPAFRKGSTTKITDEISLLDIPEVGTEDLALGYTLKDGENAYVVLINADSQERHYTLNQDLSTGDVLVDSNQAGIEAISEPVGVQLTEEGVSLAPLTATIIKLDSQSAANLVRKETNQTANNTDASQSHTTLGIGLGMIAVVALGGGWYYLKHK